MARPTGRVLTLLELLQSGGTRTTAELAERLGVDRRTVQRYVDHLIDLDVPVESVRGRYGGYRLSPGYRWLRVELRAERLDWLPAVLASLDRPFVIEQPVELRDLVAGLADRLASCARAVHD